MQNLESGSAKKEPISSPIPVIRRGGMWESPELRVASDAHSKTAPKAARSLFTSTEYSASTQ
jgi:hypothetical protein